ncbi:alpha/beta hydrolase [uncultured Devosia sp.]|uniref:alpha/beta hydrolase n=1 Tax=uncultured Devosia sp. TaxID=211434 RepID=UPI0035CC006D
MSEFSSAADMGGIGRLAELINGDPMERLDADMRHVLDAMTELGARPLEMGSPLAARRQPRLTDAIAAILARQGRAPGEDGVGTEPIAIAGAEGELAGRVYRPAGLLSRLNPMILYFHGGGFVTGDLDSHDASARALARRTGAIVISADYRLGPEHTFPAAHEDAYASWRWLVGAARELGGDPRRLAIAGEDAGANLAMNVALRARDAHLTQPIHQVLIHPIAGSDMSRPSYGEALRARPIGMPAMQWRMRHALDNREQMDDARFNLAGRDDLAGVAPATIILAEIDPLRSEGEALAEALDGAGVASTGTVFEGVTQGFFGLGLIVTKALFAQSEAAEALSRAFGPGRKS